MQLFKDILGSVFVFFFTWGYVVLVLMIISFVTLSILHFSIEGILTAGFVCAVVAEILHIVKKVKEYKRRHRTAASR